MILDDAALREHGAVLNAVSYGRKLGSFDRLQGSFDRLHGVLGRLYGSFDACQLPWMSLPYADWALC